MKRYVQSGLVLIVVLLPLLALAWMSGSMVGGQGYTCDGTPDWQAYNAVESFERGQDTFCTQDWTESESDGAAGVIDVYNTTQVKHLNYSTEIVYDNDTAGDQSIEITLDSAVDSDYIGFWGYVPLPDTQAILLFFSSEDSGNDDICNIRITDDGDDPAVKLYGSALSTEHFDITENAWYFFSISITDNAGECDLKLYNSSGVALETNNGGGDYTLDHNSDNQGDIIQYMWEDTYGNSTAITGYIDGIKRGTTWVTPSDIY